MGIREPFVSEIAPDTYAINEFGLAAMYLAVGSERALLIDTGCGLTDLPALVRRFTDKPLDVMLTHCHPDHAGGIGWFDRIYLHPDDFPAVRELDADEIRGYNRMLGEQGSFQVYEYDPDAVHPLEPLPELIPLTDGFVFDLGGRTLEVIGTPGHTPGSVCLLDAKNRILFSGDACNVNLGLSSRSLQSAAAYFDRLLRLQDRFDQNWNGHLGYAGAPECLPTPPHVLPTCAALCASILDGSAEIRQEEWFGGMIMHCATCGGVRICYGDDV